MLTSVVVIGTAVAGTDYWLRDKSTTKTSSPSQCCVWKTVGPRANCDLIERYPAVSCIFAGETQHAFADDVARYLGGAATKRARLPRQITVAVADQMLGAVDHPRAASDGQRRVEFELMSLGVVDPND